MPGSKILRQGIPVVEMPAMREMLALACRESAMFESQLGTRACRVQSEADD